MRLLICHLLNRTPQSPSNLRAPSNTKATDSWFALKNMHLVQLIPSGDGKLGPTKARCESVGLFFVQNAARNLHMIGSSKMTDVHWCGLSWKVQ